MPFERTLAAVLLTVISLFALAAERVVYPSGVRGPGKSATGNLAPHQSTVTPGPDGTPTPTITPPPLPTCPPLACHQPSLRLLETNDVVFRGTPIEIEQLGAETRWSFRVRFLMHAVWKGPADDEIEVVVSSGAWSCDQAYELGVPQTVFAIHGNRGLWVGFCRGRVDRSTLADLWGAPLVRGPVFLPSVVAE